MIRANRDTLALIGGACALTFAIAYGLHGRSPDMPTKTVAVAQHEDWTGHLAGLQPTTAPTDVKPEPLSSDSLTIPKAQLALPVVPAKPKVRPCDATTPCVVKAVAPVPPVRRMGATGSTAGSAPSHADNGLLHTLNPLNHMPDLATIRRPFAYAGDMVSGWMKRF